MSRHSEVPGSIIPLFQPPSVVSRSIAAGSVTIDGALGQQVTMPITTGGAFTVANPLNFNPGDKLTLTLSNQSGGAHGAISWGSNFKVAATAITIANGFNRTFEFLCVDGVIFRELMRGAADVPN